MLVQAPVRTIGLFVFTNVHRNHNSTLRLLGYSSLSSLVLDAKLPGIHRFLCPSPQTANLIRYCWMNSSSKTGGAV